jgi:hypothetical protein
MKVVECEDNEDEEGCANMGMGEDDIKNTHGFWLEMKGEDKHTVFHVMWSWKRKNSRKGKPFLSFA